MDAVVAGHAFLFAGWRYDPVLSVLSRRESSGAWYTVPLGARALGILGLLLEQHGTVVSRDRLVETVWPTSTVEPNNLTVQIAGLRRVLDGGREGESLIQTVPGQGYRLACDVQIETSPPGPVGEKPARDPAVSVLRGNWLGLFRRHRRALSAGAVLFIASATILIVRTVLNNPASQTQPVSVVIVSFSDVADGKTPTPLARALTENVASDLARLHLFGVSRAVVTASGAALKEDAFQHTRQARYVLRGSLHQLATTTSLDVQLLEAERGTQLWWQRFDIDPGDTAQGQRNAVRRVIFGAGPVILRAEIERRQQKRPEQPSAIDLMLQARLLTQLPPSKERLTRVRDLFERALKLDPSSVILKGQLVTEMMDSEDFSPSGFKSVLEQARVLVAEIQAAIPNSQMALRTYGQWLIWQDGRCPEAIEAARKLADLYPEVPQADRWLGRCLVLSGRANEGLPWLERAVRVSGSSDSWQFSNFGSLGDALLDIGRFQDAIGWYQRALAVNPDDSVESQSRRLSRIAIAQALDGDIADARQTMVRAQALWPYWTVRGEKHFDQGSRESQTRILRLQEGLRLAGVRDHADEDADFDVAPIATLQQVSSGHTSLTVPGATTLRTADVAPMTAAGKAIIIDTMSRSSGSSLPGAIGLRYVGAGGSVSDLAQDHLRQVMRKLTKGDLAMPILAVGWNSESFDSINLTLRLVALGYCRVFWYRGGHEAWEVSGAPETPLTIREW